MIRCVMADDHVLVREILCKIMEQTSTIRINVSFRQRCVIEKSGAISWAEPRGYGARKCVRC